MNYLLIDIGNSKIKFTLSKNGKLQKADSITYNKSGLSKFISNILKTYKNKFDKIFLSSLDSKNNSILKSVTKKYNTIFISVKTKMPVKIDYMKTLGSDRICSSVAAFSKYSKHKNILVIDLGTATTFNIISKGVYKGGMISAGIKTAADALLNKTSLPNVVFNGKISLINRTTKNAIKSGIIFQQILFIQKAIEEYKKIYKDLFVVATGGGTEIIGKRLKDADRIELNLVLEGLNQIALYNETVR